MGLKIAIGGLRQETNTFSPMPTTLSDFQMIGGQEILHETLGLDWPDVQLHPTFVASAMPGGLVEAEAYRTLKTDLLAQLEATLPVDGVYLDLHGAMEVETIGDAEGDLVQAVRQLVGPEILIAVSLDLHANVSPKLVKHADIVTAFRTAPHRDYKETCQRALRLLIDACHKQLKPVSVLIKPPLLLTGEEAMTDQEPAKSLYAQLPQIDAVSGIMSASILIGCAWTDSVFTSTSIVVTAESDKVLAEKEAAKLAEKLWKQRDRFDLGVETASVPKAILSAMTSRHSPVFISDSGDNVTAGAAGDIPLVAKQLLQMEAEDAVVAGLWDPEAVQACASVGVGGVVSITIGGKVDQKNGQPLSVVGKVKNLIWDDDNMGDPAIAVLQVKGVSLILAIDRRAFTTRAAIAKMGIDPMQQKIVVVKQGYLFPDLADHAPQAIMALSPGASSLQKATLPYQNLSRPIYPLDDVSWEASSP
ncbi:MAG: M81 family metallopeptidase [Chloroflexota bacterium]